ncbi:MAG: hypothetical protein Q9182_003323 [Xanthomendoza sp. 2 TL-2023]
MSILSTTRGGNQQVFHETCVKSCNSSHKALLALSKAAPFLRDGVKAKELLEQLSPYLSEAPAQSIRPSPLLRSIEPSPWEVLTSALATAIFAIGLRHTSLRQQAWESLDRYLQNCLRTATSAPAPDKENAAADFVEAMGADHALEIATLSTSLLGFLEAATAYCHFYTLPQRIRLLGQLRQVFNESFMVSVEGTFSSLRTIDETPSPHAWRSYTRRYAAAGRPLGAMLLQHGFMQVVLSCSSLQILGEAQLQKTDALDILMSPVELFETRQHPDSTYLTEVVVEIASQELNLIEDGADYLQLGSVWQRRIALSTKASTLHTYLNCMIADGEIAEPENLISWLEDIVTDPIQMADDALAAVVLKSVAIISRYVPASATSFSRLLPRFIVQGSARGETVEVASRSLALILQLLSQDAVITGLYSLGNVLSASSTERAAGAANGSLGAPRSTGRYQQTGSSISLDISGDEETTAVYGNIVRAIVGIANSCQDDKITALALSMLLQKLGRINMAVDIHIIREAARLVAAGGPVELKSLLKLYTRIGHDAAVQGNETLLAAVLRARMYLASTFQDSPLFSVYLTHLLESVISKGDVHESDNTHQADVELAALELAELLEPLAALVERCEYPLDTEMNQEISRLRRDVWFNMVVHNVTPNAKLGRQHDSSLRVLAMQTRPLVAEDRADQLESEIELNTVLRRGMNAPHTAEQKARLISMLPKCESDIRGLSYPKVIFLHAAYLVETLRADGGDCTHILTYFLDPILNGSAMENCMVAIADEVFKIFHTRMLNSHHDKASAPVIAKQLAHMFTGCCHRIPRVQQIAASCADRIISAMPSSLCQKSSLFALLELLSIMWMSCLDSEIDEYDWKSRYVSDRRDIEVELSDDFELRKSTLNTLYKLARAWVMSVISIAPLDVKGLLQTYLAEYADDGAYGHVSLGRSFAVEMGSVIPATDQKLDGHTTNGSTAHPEKVENDGTIIQHLEHRSVRGNFTSIEEMRDILRRAAALLCKARTDQSVLVHQLVSVPFTTFTKQSIKLGVSLWLGVINENPQMESRILIEVVERHLDPFYLKEDFAPSDKASLIKNQQAAHNLIAPHLRILQFFASHFNATRLGSPHTQKMFERMITVSLVSLRETAGHPLAHYGNHPFILQYAMRALESHSIDVTFFYVPQIVQALRYDALGYVQRYIIETAKFSQLFAHQIIWNMKANAYKDEDSSIEDTLKPTLDAVMNNMIASFSGADKAFYEREFSFFNEITDISGKLRPYIKKSKAEKKQKIEEELRKIKVEVGVYLPSNPDGVVIGIDRQSGKPLQSHAKAPYMATFRIKKDKGDLEGTDDMLEASDQAARTGGMEQQGGNTYEVWQSAIFKVGDDCRQDVLALQMIAAFRGIFNSVGLDVYVYPYRVTATAPGCGVIDVLPNSISRDMLGREAVNGLYDYFVSKYGAESSIRFQEARSNFVKSMAAYSLISYLLQFKDRHNGNIMVDDAGHILHIDFGFCFDIAPGGVRFERAPFKLTSEMVAVMGGSTTSQPYRWFEELCIKAFLASRQHTEKLCHLVVLMLGSGLPCFKPQTITHLRERFVLEKSDREAAGFMRDLIKKSYASYSTKGYDQFQLLTNGIPY